MINTGDIQHSYDNTPYYCTRLASLLSEVGDGELVFALAPPTTPMLEEQHARLLNMAHVARRRQSELYLVLPIDLFQNANWTIMLACFAALLEGHSLCVKQIQSLLDQSHTALLRHIDALEQHGLIGRQRDPQDGRRTLVLLSGQGAAAMANYLDRCGNDWGVDSPFAGGKPFPLRQDRFLTV